MQHRRRNEVYEEEQGLVDLPQGFPDDSSLRKVKVEDRQRKQKRKLKPPGTSSGANSNWVVPFAILVIIVVAASYFLVTEHEKVQMEHLREDIIHDQVEPLSKEWEEKYAKIQEENEQLKKHADEYAMLKQENERLEENEGHQSKLRQNYEKQINYYKKYKKDIQERIRQEAHALLLEKFGPGPHHVEIQLAFDPDFPAKEESDTDDPQRIVIEMAPVEELPHAVYNFLEKVTRGLYDGCSFHRNAGHVIQGGPAPNFLSPPDPQLHKKFKAAGLYSIVFQEYSSNFPHEKYTLGLAGRPGGPDFYISTEDNSRLHGPGGQRDYDDPSEADPCFAKVIEGFSVVDRMQLSPLKPGGYKAMKNNVAIVSMKLL